MTHLPRGHLRLEYLTEDQLLQLGHALYDGHHNQTYDTAEFEMFADWAHKVITNATLLQLILNGEINARWSPEADDFVFSTWGRR